MDLSIQAFGAIVYDSNGVIFGVKIEKIDKVRRNTYETIISHIAQP